MLFGDAEWCQKMSGMGRGSSRWTLDAKEKLAYKIRLDTTRSETAGLKLGDQF
jgi:hypothetical protein